MNAFDARFRLIVDFSALGKVHKEFERKDWAWQLLSTFYKRQSIGEVTSELKINKCGGPISMGEVEC